MNKMYFIACKIILRLQLSFLLIISKEGIHQYIYNIIYLLIDIEFLSAEYYNDL